MKNEVKHTARSSYRCQYHIVFAPKYRRKVIFRQICKDIGEILRKLCNEMKEEIIEAEACVDHIHMLVSIPPYMNVGLDAEAVHPPAAEFDQLLGYYLQNRNSPELGTGLHEDNM